MPYDADLLAFLRSELKELQRSLIPEWGKGNHDALNFYDRVPLAAQRRCQLLRQEVPPLKLSALDTTALITILLTIHRFS